MLSIQSPIRGDDALLKLAQSRLGEAGLGGELYPATPQHLQDLLDFRPRQLSSIAHLPRDIDLLKAEGKSRLLDFVRVAAGNLYGLVIHDQLSYRDAPDATTEAMGEVDRQLRGIESSPLVFMEYAAGLEPEYFTQLFERCEATRKLFAAIDIGHVGIHVCRRSYRSLYPTEDVCALHPGSPDLSERIGDIQTAVADALPAVLAMIDRLAQLGNPLHFHLHDGHPISQLSRFGVSDHLSFLQQITLPFPHSGTYLLPGMFGLSGMRKIVQAAARGISADKLSFTLEIHPQEGSTPLGSNRGLFEHWRDLTNGERMNYWLDRLIENAVLVRQALRTP